MSKKKNIEKRSEFADTIAEAFITGIGVAIIVLVVTFCFKEINLLSRVSGRSMEPTLVDGQIMYMDKRDITNGDIVVAVMPEIVHEYHKDTNTVIKRVIGIPGDEIQITNEGIFVNGERLIEEYLSEENKAYDYSETKYDNLTLGADEYYLMGDNRMRSWDSRDLGVFKEKDILAEYSEQISMYLIGYLVIGFIFCVAVMYVVQFLEEPIRKVLYIIMRIK